MVNFAAILNGFQPFTIAAKLFNLNVHGAHGYVRTQLTFTCLKSTIKTLEKGVKYVQS